MSDRSRDCDPSPMWWLLLAILASLLIPRPARSEEPPGARTTWAERPTLAQWQTLATWDDGPAFVIALSPKRAEFIATEVTGLREQLAASQQADELTLLRLQVSDLETQAAAHRVRETSLVHDAITWQVKATRPKGRWVAALAGFGAGTVAGVAVSR